MDLILHVFTTPGQIMSGHDAYQALLILLNGDPWAKQKAAGSLGGAVQSGFLKKIGSDFQRTR